MIIKEGYAALSSRVAATLDIRLNTEVKLIRLDDAQSNVEVVVSSEGKTTSLRAGYVVVTLPLGVLKSRVVSARETSCSIFSLLIDRLLLRSTTDNADRDDELVGYCRVPPSMTQASFNLSYPASCESRPFAPAGELRACPFKRQAGGHSQHGNGDSEQVGSAIPQRVLGPSRFPRTRGKRPAKVASFHGYEQSQRKTHPGRHVWWAFRGVEREAR